MIRTYRTLPIEAIDAIKDLICSWERRASAREQDVRDCETEIEALRHSSRLSQQEYQHEWTMLGYTVGAEAIGQPEGEANADRRRDELRAALKSEHESAIATARARLGQLEERRDSLRSQLTQERARTQALRDAKGLPVGLAPWDALAVRAQRDLDRSAGSPDTLPIDERAEMLKGCEAADLVQQRLGISRSTYYERYRALLRPYALMPRTYEYRGGGRSLFHARATVRFRRDEIEAMLGFLTAQAC